MTTLDLAIEEKNGLKIVRIKLDTISLFESRNLQNDIESRTADSRVVALDLSAVDYMDSSALILFLKLSENLNLKGGFLVLFGIRESVQSMMTMTYLDHIVEIVRTEEDAIKLAGTAALEKREFISNLRQAVIFRGESRYHVIPYADIIHLASQGRTTTVHATTGSYKTNKLLKEMESRLTSPQFLRIHKSYVVNMDFVNGMQYSVGGMYTLFLKDKGQTSLPVGRIFVPRLKAALGMGSEVPTKP
ncbi:MAG: LytTR family transcriptional regulator DNA-binding domain-containing protein [Spirochaetia bacterium]|nr:LytTR family transcriptional regulator DNA-binding domain-containing protein [Spirochaetia bacterium]